ncbi:polysaccharide deacetylase family protein [Streptomyces sp. H10-C2]|uniref:polysaccharide deacetylase family protein n=1 Tax=unclassified Streptomyces TaxID=2593676 RepID=UPI0024BB7D11|nr:MULTISPECIES: polysaccharide deacetylase family protein [unclassified Streptomyces]MDJ0340343.1 polysaccharide deacetylase family protein [Streptomyces sp. PH10-H1]MDJ0368209.1 polysaccharide deacetylase family protein [Streptomyces sp. H10-C2]
MYHSVGDCTDDPYQVTVTPDRLDHQLSWLDRRDLTGVSMSELLRARAAGRGHRLVGLTFDDGYTDFLEHAVPLLRRHAHTATVFVLPGRLGGVNAWDVLGPRKPLLTECAIRAVAAAGMEIGSHGLVHQDLTALDDDDALAAEVRGSRDLLHEITGSAPAGFCYPYGKLDARTVDAVRAAGYQYGCAVGPGPLNGPHALPRAYIGERDTAGRLHLKHLLHRLPRRRLSPAAGPVEQVEVPDARDADTAHDAHGEPDRQDSR